jgi:hypothetical protein
MSAAFAGMISCGVPGTTLNMPSNDTTEEELLLERFVASFEKLDERCRRWPPIKVRTEFSLLEPIYSKLPARFPPIFERLVVSYRWAEVDLQFHRLLANPSGPGLGGLLREMSGDPIIWKCLLDAGYIQFGKGPDIDYDPICFDIGSRNKNGDCKIVKIDHEQILCHNRVRLIAELAPSFEQLMLHTIDKADGR